MIRWSKKMKDGSTLSIIRIDGQCELKMKDTSGIVWTIKTDGLFSTCWKTAIHMVADDVITLC